MATQIVAVKDKFKFNIVCYDPTKVTTNGIWQDHNILEYSLPVFIIQVALVVLTTRVLVFVLKPLKQPKVVAEIIGGIVLGPSVAGRMHWMKNLFPTRSVTVLETMANIGLLYFLFLIGIEMDLDVIKQSGKKALGIAVAGMFPPFIISGAASTWLSEHVKGENKQKAFLLFFSITVSVTAFPVLARILAELKLLNTELGRLAMSSAVINDMAAWILLALAIAIAEHQDSGFAFLWVVLSSTAFVLFCLFAVQPAVMWLVRKTPEGEPVSDFFLGIILTGVMVSGFITDAIGIHSIFGAFIFGLVIPNGTIGVALVEKLEDFVSGLLLPLFFAISGLRTDVSKIDNYKKAVKLIGVITIACISKVLCTMSLATFYRMPSREGLSLGMLMNSKGLIEMIVLNVGLDQKIFDGGPFAVLVLMAVLMTSLVTPTVMAMYKPARRLAPYKRRTVQRTKQDGELRLLACVHGPRNVPSIINLLDATNPTKKSPIFVYALHLVELTGRASAMLIVHNTRKTGRRAANRTQAQSDHIANAFESYEQHAGGVCVQLLTAISPYSTMHEDICNLAEDKRVALILLPFHKEQTVDGGMEATNPAFRGINQHVLANAPCSVGILVDRGLGSTHRAAMNHISHHVVILYFGGPDDREALAYASRMADHPGISLTCVRFMIGPNAIEPSLPDDESRILSTTVDTEKERQLDDQFINEFRVKNVGYDSVIYVEKVVNNGEETVATIRELDSINDLYIVGRGQGVISPLTAGLSDWSECPELGAIGDLLASSDFAANVSVLVIQQYVGSGTNDAVSLLDSPRQQMDMFRPNGRNDPRQSNAYNHGWSTRPIAP